MSQLQGKQFTDELISRIDIVDLISENVVLKKAGSNFTGLCPFHQEKSPSFSVNQVKQTFRCFGCGEGGNAITYYMKYHNLDFRNTLKELASRYGLEMPAFSSYNKEESDKKDDLKKTIFEIYKTATEFYRWNLQHKDFGLNARDYLDKRKVNPLMIDKFLIGFAQDSWDSLYLFLQKKGFSQIELKESGLVVEKENGGFYDRFRNRIIFPIHNEKDEVIAFGGRTLDPNTPAKYINSPETIIYTKGQHLYALNFAKNKIKEKGEIILVEGYLDVISCHEFGFENTVASLGTALTPDQAKKLLRYNSEKKVIVAYDADNAGQRAAEKGTNVLEEVAKGVGISIYVLKVPSGKDPDEFLHSEGQKPFQKLIDNVKPIIEFKIEKSLSVDLSTAEGKSNAVEGCIEVLLKIENEIYQSEMIKKIANWQYKGIKLNVREQDIRRRLRMNTAPTPQVNQFQNNRFKNFRDFKKFDKNKVEFDYIQKSINQKTLSEYEKESSLSQAEKGIIYFMMERRKAIDYIVKRLEHIVFHDNLNEEIKNKILELHHSEQLTDWQSLLQALPDIEHQKRIVSIWDDLDKTDISSDKILKDFLRQTLFAHKKNHKDELKQDIDIAMKTGDKELIRTLMMSLWELEKELKAIESEIYNNE
ncbi:MAG: DNA primase [Candidatus Sericytochromatia bacterium]